MNLKAMYQNITIKQTNFFIVILIFIFSIVFVSLLVEEIYKDYEIALHQSTQTDTKELSNTVLLKQKKEKLKSILIKTVLAVVTLSFILLAMTLVIYKIYHNLLQRDIQTFLDFFEDAVNEKKVINPHAIFFKDFKVMVGFANKMVSTINKQKENLQELNLSLEDKVKVKTADLQKINEKLLLEKSFSEEILGAQKEFLRYTVHETNTPLSVILTSIELYSMKNQKDRQLLKIEAAAKNIFNIYDDLSYLVKKDQVNYPKVAIDLVSFIGARIEFFRDVANLSKIDFFYNPHYRSMYIYFNETKLQRVVDNTVTNAIKYTQAGEIVTIELKNEGSNVDVSVSSKSKTIENPDKIFDAYYRETNNVKGFGLGLKLVKNICEEENVLISINSKDEITTFTYRFKMMGE